MTQSQATPINPCHVDFRKFHKLPPERHRLENGSFNFYDISLSFFYILHFGCVLKQSGGPFSPPEKYPKTTVSSLKKEKRRKKGGKSGQK